jgi:hypothetical protein
MLVAGEAAKEALLKLGLRPGKIPVTIQGQEIMPGSDIIVSVEGVKVNQEDIGELRRPMKQLLI